MDLSPCTSTLPPSRLGGRTRIFIAACSSEIRPDLAYALELALDAGVVAGAKHPLQIAERRAESRNGLGQRVAVLLENLPPDRRARVGDARRILEAARGHIEELRVHPDHGVHERVGHEVRQVADGGHRAVVGGGIHRHDPAARRFPEFRDALHRVRRGPVGRGQDDRGASKEIGPRDREAGEVRARHGVAADEIERARRAQLLGGARDGGLGAADIGDERLRLCGLPHGGHLAFERRDGRREHDHVGAGHSLAKIRRHGVDGALVERRLEAGCVAPDADDFPRQRLGAGRLGYGAAKDPKTYDCEAADHPTLPSARTFFSALMRRRFSSGVPIVTRSAVSMPKLDMGRTITPSFRSRWKTSLPLRATSRRMKLARDGTYLSPMDVNSSHRKCRPASFIRRHSRMWESTSRAANAATWARELTLKGARIRLRSAMQSGSAMA